MPVHPISRIKNLSGKRVLVRVDFNVPIVKWKVDDDFRLRETLPTLKYLIGKKARVIVITHLGRPKGTVVDALRVRPIVKHLSELLKREVKSLRVSVGKSVMQAIEDLQPANILFLENIQFNAGETQKDPQFARELASYCDAFVMDCFGQSHRDYASISGVQKYVPSYAGLLLQKEIRGLERVTNKPKKPFVAVIGGAKTETKIPVIKNILPKADHILVGGGIVNTYLAARGYGVGKSLVDTKYIEQALAYCKKRKVILPTDVVVGSVDGNHFRVVEIEKKSHQICRKNEGIYDIGPQTIELFAQYMQKAKTLVWNGAMGVFEVDAFSVGTLAVAGIVAEQSKKTQCFGVIGGGETLQSMEMVGGIKDIDLVSTGGGAMLEFLAGERLPGIEALRRA